jgi:hypothetical protein
MYSMAARSSSSLQLMQVPFGGMALSPFLTDESRASLPLAMRGGQRLYAKFPVWGCISRHKFTSVMMGLGIHLLRSVRETV